MTQPYPLPREVRSTGALEADGVTTGFGPFDFKVFDLQDLTVETRATSEDNWTATGEVSITKVSNASFDYFTTTFQSAPAAGTQFQIRGTRLHERSIALSTGTALDINALEKELSKQGVVLQEHHRDIHAIIAALGGASLPGIPGGGGAPFLANVVDSRNFNLVGDGVADDTFPFATFVAACQTTGLPGFLAPGRYRISNVTISQAVQIFGMSGLEGFQVDRGTWIYHDDTANAAIRFVGVDARGSVFRNIAFHQTHSEVTTPLVSGSWTPTVYPYMIEVLDCYGGVQLRDLFMWGVYRGISVVNSGRTEINGLFGQFFQNVIFADDVKDACEISNIHAWPYWNPSPAVFSWQHLNHVTFLIGRADSIVFSGKIFSYCGRYGFQFANTASGKATRIKVHSAQFDAVPCGVFVSAGADNVTAEFGILDCQGQDVAQWNSGAGALAAVAGVPAIYIDADNTRIRIQSFRAEFHAASLVSMSNASKGNRIGIGSCYASTYNMEGGSAAFYLGTTNSATNGGIPENRCYVGHFLLMEGGNGAPLADPLSTGLLEQGGSGSGGGGGVTDQLQVNGFYVLRVDAPSGVAGQLLLRSETNGANQVVQFIAEGTNPNVDLQLIPKGTGRLLDAAGNPIGSGGAGGAKLVSADATQEAEIKNTGGFFITDITQGFAANFLANGNIEGGPDGEWVHSGTYDLKNFVVKSVAAVGGGVLAKLVSADATQEAEIKNTGGFFITDITQGAAANFLANGNIEGGPDGEWVHSGTYDLKNFVVKSVAAVGGGVLAKLVSADATQEAEIKNTGGFFITDITQGFAANFLANGNVEAGPDGEWVHTGTYDLKNFIVKSVAAGGGGGDRLIAGTATAILADGSGLTIAYGGNSVRMAADGNLFSGLYAPEGNIFQFINAEATRVFNANIGGASVNYAASAGSANSANSASSATNATFATYLGGGTGISNSGGALAVGAARYQTDANSQGSAWGAWGGYCYNAVVASSDETVKKNIKPLEAGLAMVRAIAPRQFRFRATAKVGDHTRERFGFLAQDVEQHAPNLIGEHHVGKHKTLDYSGLIPVLWNAVQELAERLETLENGAI